ncbi:MAG: tRNA (adenosine(37)-N6)-threonylcarbamoyltransferase complex dimerization subunit type 1 TsaB [Bacteroidales bacterium]|nr:tRNA (adenosine(37)-N6)-threonylcarbamoyltransferase complex dimerization subunit type 1 TsaB [Bacteroidales bacterium]
MSKIILIETSTSLCSVALAIDGRIAGSVESTEPRAHASMTAPYVSKVLCDAGLAVADCDAVCVSAGPGSYTGLRVGSSTAKGLCFAAGIPLLAVGTLEILAFQAISGGLLPEGYKYIVPMIDARRMEVYTAVFSPSGERLSEINSAIIGPDSFREQLDEGPVLFIGDGAEKCAGVIKSPMANFVGTCPRAEAMLIPAEREYKEKRFKDTAYFEPFYLKDFVATVSGKKLF